MDAGSRAAKRDFWNSPKVHLIGRIFDRAAEVIAATALVLIFSIKF